MPFHDRADAGRRLAKALLSYKNKAPIVLALPRGGVPVAAEVAHALDAPLDLVLVRKIGVPFHPELAMGAVVDGAAPLIVRNEDVIEAARISEADFASVCTRELAEIQRRRRLYVGERPHPQLKGRVAILIDDGIATGASTRAALRSVRKQGPEMLILAVPVAPSETLRQLQGEADTIVCLESYEEFGAVGFYYSDFRQVSDTEVREILAALQPADSTSAVGR
ncbi:phosphoribosyltransferase [uncultured Methylovirgula sp.]|uniref:phosphoribosyltransferase n=1 Tax=uncultured Methylovirgula sp. TaxID=1285960 RepID=UPI002611187B|nr:phosphoribosyltransferase [uncultured Methylovirgula sp.]